MNARGLYERILMSAPGTVVIYHHGDLASSRTRPDVKQAAEDAWQLYANGFAELVQRREGDGFAYLAIRRRHVRKPRISTNPGWKDQRRAVRKAAA